MWRAALVAVAWMSVSPSPAIAADAEPLDGYGLGFRVSTLAGDVDWTIAPLHVRSTESHGAALPSLYVGLAALNALDAYTTSKMVAAGAAEGNPLMRGVAGNTVALWAIKGAATAGSIFFAESLRTQHHRRAACAAMLITNSVMAGVTAKNLHLLVTSRATR